MDFVDETDNKALTKQTNNTRKEVQKDKPIQVNKHAVNDVAADKSRARQKQVVIDDFTSGSRRGRGEGGGNGGGGKSKFRTHFESTSFIWRVTFMVLVVAFLCHVIAYGTPNWLYFSDVSGEGHSVGLWNNCTSINDCAFREDTSVCLNAVRGFGGVSIVCDVIAFILLYNYIREPQNRRCLAVTTIAFCFVSALCIQCAMGVFGRNSACIFDLQGTQATWGWSIAISFMSLLLTCVAGLLFLIQELRGCSGRRKHVHRRRRRRNNLGMNIT